MSWLIPTALAQSTDAATTNNGNAGFIIILVAAFVIFAGVVLFIKKFANRQELSNNPTLRKVTLLIIVPKEFSGAEEQAFGQSQDPTKRAISVAESLFSFLGGVKAQRWYQSMSHGRTDHFSLEIVGHNGVIGFYAVVPVYMRDFLERQIQAQYPTAHIEEVEPLEIIRPKSIVLGATLKQRKSFIFPMLTYEEMDQDPLSALTNVLSRLNPEESLAIQYVIRSAHPSWHDRANQYIRGVQTGKGVKAGSSSMAGTVAKEVFRTFVPNKNPSETQYREYVPSAAEQQVVERVNQKNSKAGFEANVRIVSVSPDPTRAHAMLKNTIDSFSQYTSYDQVGNGFLRFDPFKKDKTVVNFIHRRYDNSRECVFSANEMASFWHLPLPWTETPNILWLPSRKASVPADIPREGLILGVNRFRGVETEIRITREDRRRHVYMIGKSGVGKSVLLESMAIQDIQNGEGVCVIDPHGDLVEHILSHVPRERAQDVVYFNPSDIERPVGLNMLEAETPDQRDFVAQEMISIFYKLFPPEMIGPIFEHNMRNVMLTLMEGEPGNKGTIAEIPRMFTDTVFQKKRVALVKDPIVRSFWEKEMAKTADFHKSEMLGYIISKVGRFVENSMMRNIIGQEKSGFDVFDIMNNRKILLVNLSKGTTGEVNSSLLGLIIVSKLQMAALRRATLPEDQRNDFYLYIDEFQNFVTDSIATILSEARKYRLDLIIAHQYISQLVDGNDTKIRDAVFGNAGTIIAFRVGSEDATSLEKEFEPVFSAYDLVNVEKYTAAIKLLINNTGSRPFTMQTLPPQQGDPAYATALKNMSRLAHGKERQIVEREILERTQLGVAAAPLSPMQTERKI
ncbi:MAG: type IV secretion system DNA-binding domain-containing protein [Patescibacteria group bacterium]|jgi:hypothetical protein